VDVLLTGYTANWWSDPPTCQIFHNERKDLFTGLVQGFVGVGRSCGAVSDYNNDGLLDFVLAGTTGPYYGETSPTNILYRNKGDGTFSNALAGLPAVYAGAMAWGDYDSDGQLDLAIVGNAGTSNIARIYRNSQGVFTDIGANLPGVCRGSVAWGDYNNDGQLDLLLAGQTNADWSASICRIYQNNQGDFTDINAGLPDLFREAAWGDFDGDGCLDVLGSGQGIARVYRNNSGVFEDIQTGLTGFNAGAVAWGDYDNDRQLDLAIEGNWNGVHVYRNFVPLPANTPAQPSAPAGLDSAVMNNGVTLRWNAASDPHTPTPGLTYNLRVGSTPGGTEIVSPASDLVTGQRHLPQMGNTQLRRFSTLTNLPLGRFYWSVQTVNHSFVGSLWATEQTFDVTNGPPVIVTGPASNVLCCSALLNGFVTPGPEPVRGWFEWGTNTNLENSTMPQELEVGLLPKPVQQTIQDLQPHTTYSYRLAASNRTGLVLGTNVSFTTEGPAPLASTLTASNVSYTSATPFGASPLASPTAHYFIEWGTTTSYGQLSPAAISDAALRFDGVDDSVAVAWGKFLAVTNNFTMELWVNPAAGRPVTVESVGGIAGYGGQRYAVFPEGGVYGGGSHAGAGLSVGTNGVSVMEHAENYLPSVLVYSNGIAGWNHLALVYSNHLPTLFVNAILVRAGLVSSRTVHPSAGLGGMTQPWDQFGHFAGDIQDVRIWDVPLDASTIQAWMNQGITTNHPAYSHLRGYWPLSEGSGTNAADKSPGNNPGQLLNGTAWTGGRHSSAREFCAVLGGLAPGTTYHFRAVAINSGGSANGADQSFTTLSLPRMLGVTVQTAPATAGSLLRCGGSAGFGYVMEASTDLTDWVALTNLVAGSDGLFEFLDISATNFPIRFYRLKVP